MTYFRDRADAGRQLGQQLAQLKLNDVVVLALPRGGVPVAFEIAQELKAPLDVLVVRKLESPTQEGLSLGAVAEGGMGFLDPNLLVEGAVSRPELEALAEAEMREVKRRVDLWRGAWPPYPVENKTAVIVDDGAVTGGRIRVAAIALRSRNPKSILLAVPVAPMVTLEGLSNELDGVVCLHPQLEVAPLNDVYERLPFVSDHEVATLLERSQAWTTANEAFIQGAS